MQIIDKQEAARNKLQARQGELVDRKYILISEGQGLNGKEKRELKRLTRYLDKMDEPYRKLYIEILQADKQPGETP